MKLKLVKFLAILGVLGLLLGGVGTALLLSGGGIPSPGGMPPVPPEPFHEPVIEPYTETK